MCNLRIQEMTCIEKLILTESLLRLPSMSNHDDRQSVLDLLPHDFANGVRYNNINKLHVLNIINRCGSFNESFVQLLESLRMLDKNTNELSVLETTIQKLILMRDLIELFQNQVNDSYQNYILT